MNKSEKNIFKSPKGEDVLIQLLQIIRSQLEGKPVVEKNNYTPLKTWPNK